jgi:hypothetical protein
LNRKVETSDSSEAGETQPEPQGDVAQESRAAKAPTAKGARKSAAGGAPGDVGQLLRGAYRQTVDEAIPDDLMDLLKKLE